MTEEWRDIPGTAGYQATRSGRIRAAARRWSFGISVREKPPVEIKTTGGKVRLKCQGGQKTFKVSELVAKAFPD